MPAGTSFGSDAGTQGRQLAPRRILQPHGPPLANVGGAGRHPCCFFGLGAPTADELPPPIMGSGYFDLSARVLRSVAPDEVDPRFHGLGSPLGHRSPHEGIAL